MKNKIPYIIAGIIISIVLSYVLVVHGYYVAYLFIASIILFFVLYFLFKNPFWGILAIIFCLPFERIPTIDAGFMTLKINQFIAGSLLFVFLANIFLKKINIRKFVLSPIFIWMYASLAVSLLFASYIPRSIIVFAFVVFTSLIAVLVNQYVVNKKDLNKILKTLFYSSLLVVIFSFYQYVGDIVGLPTSLTFLSEGYTKMVFSFPRMQAFSREPLYLGNYLLIPLGLFICFYFSKIKLAFISSQKLLLFIVAMIVVLILTVSRGAYLGFVAQLVVIFMFMATKIINLRNFIILFVSIFVVGMMTILFFQYSDEGAFDEYLGHVKVENISTGSGESVEGRIIEYNRALEVGHTNPLFGKGIGGYWIEKHGGVYNHEEIENYDIVNNQYIELYAETGLFGLAVFIVLILTIIIRSLIAYYLAQDNYLKIFLLGLLSAFVGVLVQYNFFSTLYIIHIWVLIGLLVVVQNIILFTNEKN
jgi:O-antigen ligase